MTKSSKVHNPNPTPVVYDAEGHSIDPHTTQVVERDDYTERLIESGRLLAFADRRNRAPIAPPEDPTPSPAETANAGDGTKNGDK